MAIVHQWSAGSGGGGSEIFTLTEADLNILVATSALTPFALYHVTDPLGNPANDLWVIAVASDTLSIDAEYLVGGVVTLVVYDPLAPSVTPYGVGGIPTLQQVTTAGNTTTNDIIVGSITSDTWITPVIQLTLTNGVTDQYIFNTFGGDSITFDNSGITFPQLVSFQDASGTLAFLSDLSLQNTTNVGNTTTNSIHLTGGALFPFKIDDNSANTVDFGIQAQSSSGGAMNIPDLNGNGDIIVGETLPQTLSNKYIFSDGLNTGFKSIGGNNYSIGFSGLTSADRLITIPVLPADDEFVFKAVAQTLTNKTLTASTNVLGGVTMTLGSDASFDMYYRSAGGVLTRLGNGTTGQALKATTGAAPSWGTVSASVTITETEVDFGSTPVTDKTFTITDASITALSKIMITESGNAATGRATGDSLWDSIDYSALGAAGSFTLYAKASGSIVGKRKLFYTYS